MQRTSIEWCTVSWNPVSGCTKVSPGCDNCYAERIANRWKGTPAFPVGFDLFFRDPDKLKDPIRWKQPEFVFVNSMSDLFHRDIPDESIESVWETMMEADHHIYMILTKRAARMKHKIRELGLPTCPHIWLGVSAENQELASSRIPFLLEIDTPVRFLSCEPLLEPVSLHHWLRSIAWVIAGGESGPKARKADYDWFRAVRDHCVMANVAFHLKQGNPTRGNRDRVLDGRTWDEFPRVLNDKGELLPPLKKHFGVV